MIAEAIEKILSLKKPVVVDVAGRPYSLDKLNPVSVPVPAPFTVSSLSAIVDYLTANLDELNVDATMIHVVSPDLVVVMSSLLYPFAQRAENVKALYQPPGFRFDSYLPLEDFNIGVLSKFANTGVRADLLKLTGTITGCNEKVAADDGITQIVVAKQGVVRTGEVEIRNPMMLAPLRTFPEVEQPVSPFVFRVKPAGDGFTAGLWEADGGAWKLQAIANIAAWLRERLTAYTVLA